MSICCYQEIFWIRYFEDILNIDWQHIIGWLHRDVAMLHLYQKFCTSIRTGDLDLWVHYLSNITIFFLPLTITIIWYLVSATQDFMSCVIFHNKLLKLKVTHPEIHKDFINGIFSMKTTKKAFSRLSVDLTLE